MEARSSCNQTKSCHAESWRNELVLSVEKGHSSTLGYKAYWNTGVERLHWAESRLQSSVQPDSYLPSRLSMYSLFFCRLSWAERLFRIFRRIFFKTLSSCFRVGGQRRRRGMRWKSSYQKGVWLYVWVSSVFVYVCVCVCVCVWVLVGLATSMNQTKLLIHHINFSCEFMCVCLTLNHNLLMLKRLPSKFNMNMKVI